MNIIMTFNTMMILTLTQKTVIIKLYEESTITGFCISQDTFIACPKSSSASYGLTVQHSDVQNKWNISI
jgi:hypothetical protein